MIEQKCIQNRLQKCIQNQMSMIPKIDLEKSNCIISIFFQKTKTSVFHHQTVLLESNRRRI